jgi:hypothetical protein
MPNTYLANREKLNIVNSYMVSRYVAKETKRSGVDKVFSKKLFKLIILFEQWPSRMAWLMVIVENLQQEKSIHGHKGKRKQHRSYPIIRRLQGNKTTEYDLG